MNMKKCAAQALTYLLVVSIFLAATYCGSQAVSVISQKLPVERGKTIVIDAGHGGEDGGAVSCTGVPESRINLEIALKLNDLLHLLGHRTLMIRTTDISVYTAGQTIAQKKVSDLKERVRIIRETEDPVLVSIHQNTFSDARYSGAQIFYAAAEESQALANDLQTVFCQTINAGSNRKSKAASGVYLMEHIQCTGVLVECGFLSNAAEEAKLRTGDYQQKICCVIASTLSNFLDQQT